MHVLLTSMGQILKCLKQDKVITFLLLVLEEYMSGNFTKAIWSSQQNSWSWTNMHCIWLWSILNSVMKETSVTPKILRKSTKIKMHWDYWLHQAIKTYKNVNEDLHTNYDQVLAASQILSTTTGKILEPRVLSRPVWITQESIWAIGINHKKVCTRHQQYVEALKMINYPTSGIQDQHWLWNTSLGPQT